MEKMKLKELNIGDRFTHPFAPRHKMTIITKEKWYSSQLIVCKSNITGDELYKFSAALKVEVLDARH